MNCATMVALALLAARPAAAMDGSQTDFPEYDLAALCGKFAAKFGDLIARVCVRDENEARDAALYLWPDLPADVQTHCVIVAKLSVPATVQYQSLHNCLSEMSADQRQLGGEIPVSIRKNWLDNDIRALKAGHY